MKKFSGTCFAGRPAMIFFFVALCFLLIGSGFARAEIPPGYYQSADTSSAAALRASLHQIIDDHQRYPYSSSSTDTWDILDEAEEDPNNSSNILDVYKNASYPKAAGGNPNYNHEHTWPKSYGYPDDWSGNYPYADCYQLMLCDSSYNSSRSNKPYRIGLGTWSEKITLFNNGQGGGSGSYPGNSNWTAGSYTSGGWEVWNGRQGDIARAMFYMDVRYEGGNHGITGHWEPDLILTDEQSLIEDSNTGDNETVAYMGMLTDLLQWHQDDPVDDFEISRTDVVYNYQGNRNPFVDHPEWVGIIFGGDDPEIPALDSIGLAFLVILLLGSGVFLLSKKRAQPSEIP